MFPQNLIREIDQFDRLIIWKKVNGSDVEIPEPQRGLDETFDLANEKVSQLKLMLDKYLE